MPGFASEGTVQVWKISFHTWKGKILWQVFCGRPYYMHEKKEFTPRRNKSMSESRYCINGVQAPWGSLMPGD
jgi:hypothetical protein